MEPKVLFTDGEGPIVFKDLAADIMEKTVPGLFPLLSLYDDYLTEVGTEGYQAGDTLALIVPHLLAHGVTDEDVASEAKDAKVCLGVEDYIAGLKSDGWTIRIISTAYSQLWELVGKHIGVPMEDIACTTLDLKTLRKRFSSNNFLETVLAREKEILGLTSLANEAMKEVDQGKSIVKVLGKDSRFAPLLGVLDKLYWEELPSRGYQTLEAVNVIGGKRKIEAAQKFARELGVNLSDVTYVGDSITDDALHAKLSQEGGLPIAINGNNYALRNARVAVATRDMRRLRPVLDAWQMGGFEQVQRFVRLNGTSFSRTKEGSPISEILSDVRYDLIDPSDQEGFKNTLSVHREFRKLVRGAATARLG